MGNEMLFGFDIHLPEYYDDKFSDIDSRELVSGFVQALRNLGINQISYGDNGLQSDNSYPRHKIEKAFKKIREEGDRQFTIYYFDENWTESVDIDTLNNVDDSFDELIEKVSTKKFENEV